MLVWKQEETRRESRTGQVEREQNRIGLREAESVGVSREGGALREQRRRSVEQGQSKGRECGCEQRGRRCGEREDGLCGERAEQERLRKGRAGEGICKKENS